MSKKNLNVSIGYFLGLLAGSGFTFAVIAQPSSPLKGLVEAIAAATTPVIAVLAAYIAYRQASTDRARFRHDLYDRRMAVYSAVRHVFMHVFRHGTIEGNDLSELRSVLDQVPFLFDDDLGDYIREVNREALHLEMATRHMKLAQQSGPQGLLEQRAAEEAAIISWFNDQLLHHLDKKFQPYLRLEQD